MPEPAAATRTRPPAAERAQPLGAARAAGAAAVLSALAIALLLASAWHLTQGTSGVGAGDLLGLALGRDTVADGTRDVLLGSRIPRLAAGVAVGIALGAAGALFQSVSRNALASPDTLAVTAGAYLAVTAVAAFGIAVPIYASGAVAFAGGLLAAALVLALAGGAGTTTTRLVLAGSATAMALQAATSTLLILFEEETTGLFAWGNGSLSQLGLRAFWQAAPVVLVCMALALLLSRRLDLLGLGDDTAGVLGVPVRSTRIAGTLLAVLLTASAVTLAGPIGFVGLCAPAIVRLAGRAFPVLLRHGVLLPASGLTGALVVVLADALMRAAIGPGRAISIPTGVTTTLLGALVLIVLARRSRDAGPTRRPDGAGTGPRSRRRFVIVLSAALLAAAGALLLGLLAGNTWLRTGDLVVYAQGQASFYLGFVLDDRVPRVVAALAAGAALALSGSMVQATCRNPLAEPGILGITGGAGVGAIAAITLAGAGTTGMLLAAVAGGLIAFAVVYGLAWRGGLDSDRLVLVGIGFSAGAAAVSAFLLLRINPFDTPRIFTWLSGTTYNRTWEQVWPVTIALLLALPLAWAWRRELDLLALDEDTPRIVGLSMERTRLLVLGVAALLAALSVAAVGTVGFVGLVAPHAARALVGGRHGRSLPVAVLLGALVLLLADAIGRSVIAPAEIPAGLIVALIGAPYFVYLLWRSRA